MADFKRFRIWGRSSAFIVFLVGFFTQSVYQLPNCVLFCLQSRRFLMCWSGGRGRFQHDLPVPVCACVSSQTQAKASLKELGDCAQQHHTNRLTRLHTNLINLGETNVTNNVSAVTHTHRHTHIHLKLFPLSLPNRNPGTDDWRLRLSPSPLQCQCCPAPGHVGFKDMLEIPR